MSATTTPALIRALQFAVNDERDYARAASKTLLQAFFTLAGLRYAPAVGGAAALAGAKEGITVVEIGAGDLKASIELAKRGGAMLIAVDPVAPSSAAIKELEGLGGQFVEAVEKIPASSADRVFQYFPWRITGTGRAVQGGTWRLVRDTMRILKPGGAARFVTEEQATAEFLANEASKQGLRTTLAESTAGAAAPGASGAGVPNFASGLKVWVVELFK
jgi:tRNA G46 methylase TrmB